MTIAEVPDGAALQGGGGVVQVGSLTLRFDPFQRRTDTYLRLHFHES